MNVLNERRRFPRRTIGTGCLVVSDGQRKEALGTFQNISPGGAKITFEDLETFIQDESVQVWAKIDFINSPQPFLAKVVWVKFEPDSPRPITIGLKFEEDIRLT